MIRRLAACGLVVLAGGCMTVQTAGGQVTYVVVPLIGQGSNGDAYGGEVYNREGTSFYNPRWTFDPDSHPAVRAVPSGASAQDAPTDPRGSAEARAQGQLTGGAIGALVGAQAGNRPAGLFAGSAIGALAGGALADPCAPGANAGSLWGALAGGWLGSLFGGGRGRDFWTALGAAGGAVRGAEMGADSRRCR